MSVSKNIRKRLADAGIPFKANDNIADYITDVEREMLQDEVERRVSDLLDALVIDQENDHNTQETARRVAKMYLKEVFHGRYEKAPAKTLFPNVKQVNEVFTVGPIAVRSACSHHMVPILGQAWVGVIPSEKLIGLSKFNRLVDWIMSRPQIQEEAAAQLADELEASFNPQGLAIVVRAKHLCCQWRGVRDQSEMVSSVMRGVFMDDTAARNEFFAIIRSQGF